MKIAAGFGFRLYVAKKLDFVMFRAFPPHFFTETDNLNFSKAKKNLV